MSPQTNPPGLEHRLRQLDDSVQFLQTMTRTFVSLAQTEREAIADTLVSLVMTHLDARRGTVLLLSDRSEPPRPCGGLGIDDAAALSSPQATSLWRSIADDAIPRFVAREELARVWTSAPESLRNGFAAAVVSIQDRAVGVLIVADRTSGGFGDEDMSFLGAATALAGMAFANADAFQAQQRLIEDVERKATEAQRESGEKARALAELDEKLDIIERQRFAIQELSTPILQIWDNVLALPIIGVVDSKRSMDIMERLLSEVSTRQARFVILDITGVDVVDTKTADHFIKVIRAAELLGTRCVVTGIRPAVAQTLVDIGVDLSAIITLRNLQEGLMECIRRMEQQGAAMRRTVDGRVS